MTLQNKYHALLSTLRDLKSAAVAFSGGVDSTFLLAAAREAIGDKALAVIGRSPTYPKREMDEAVQLAKRLGASYVIIDTGEIEDPAFHTNPPTRCYTCKSILFAGIKEMAAERGIEHVLEGSNADDTGDFRPGMDASRRLGIHAPLMELGFTKDEIRALSRQMGLPTWNKPAFACLSSRIPYGSLITKEKLSRIEQAEYALSDLGFVHLRVRDHGDLCRVEVPPSDIAGMVDETTRIAVVGALEASGYKYICLDLKGYRTGSMNETLSAKEKSDARFGPDTNNQKKADS